MKSCRASWIIAASLAALACVAGPVTTPLLADTEISGRSPGGAFYRIRVPEGWNGDLVIWNHGFTLNPIAPVDDLGPLLELQLLEGFAVAASSYRMSGWALFKSSRDLEQLVSFFESEVGRPERVILYGASLGGLVTVAALEQADLGNVVGALSYCGALAGSRIWDGGLDLRLAYDTICSNTPEASIPGGAKGLPRNPDFTQGDLERAVDACTGLSQPKNRRTRRQKNNLRQLKRLSGLPESFLLRDLGFVTFAMADLVHDRKKLRGKIGTGNKNVNYGSPRIDAEIARVKPKKRAARRLANNFTPKGEVGSRKIIALHTSKDGLVIVENLREYIDIVPAASLTAAVAVERRPSHCEFTPGEIYAGWSSLLDWIDGNPQPTVQDLQDECEAVTPLIGDFACRFDPDFQIPDMDTRVRPR